MCRAVFARMGTPEHIARVAIEALIEASLRGIDSHGIQLLPLYLDLVDGGRVCPAAEPEVVAQTPSSTVLDACLGDGFYASMKATQHTVEKARTCGMAAAVVRRNNHNGAISHYAIHAARHGLIGIAATACAPRVTPHGGRQGLHGTNPMAYALPTGSDHPLVFDFSTGHSGAKLKARAQELGGRLPAGHVLDPAGQPSTDLEDLTAGWILPVAGPIGYGLGLLVNALCCGLADGPIGQQIPPVTRKEGPYHGSFFILALDPATFGGTGAFTSRLQALQQQISTIEPLDPARSVRCPGQRGWGLRQQRLHTGIPLADAAWERLLETLEERGVSARDWMPAA